MSKNRWLSLAALGHLLFFVVTAPPHTVHHGLHDVDPQECTVLASTLQAHGDLPEGFSVSIFLPCSHDVPISDLIHVQKPAWEAYKTRAPPVTLPS